MKLIGKNGFKEDKLTCHPSFYCYFHWSVIFPSLENQGKTTIIDFERFDGFQQLNSLVSFFFLFNWHTEI